MTRPTNRSVTVAVASAAGHHRAGPRSRHGRVLATLAHTLWLPNNRSPSRVTELPMSKERGGPPCPPTNLLGVQAVYCDANNKRRKVWVDLTQVDGISWCGSPSITRKSRKAGPPSKMPKGPPAGPTRCPDRINGTQVPPGGTPMCWWTGSKWECGEAEE